MARHGTHTHAPQRFSKAPTPPHWAKISALGSIALVSLSAYMTNLSTGELVTPQNGVAAPDLPDFVVHPAFQAVVKGGNPCHTSHPTQVFNLIDLSVETIRCAATTPLEVFATDSRPIDETDIDNMAAARTAWRQVMGAPPLPTVGPELEKQKRFMTQLVKAQKTRQALSDKAL